MNDSAARPPGRGRKILRWVLRLGLGLILILCAATIAGIMLAPDPARQTNPAGFNLESSTYLELDARTHVWLCVWLPENLEPQQTIPTILETSRYGQVLRRGWLYRLLQTYLRAPDPNLETAGPFLEQGYAFAWLQSPGSGQSTGPRAGEYPPNEVQAMSLALDWISKQPWSNGRVGATGVSYSGTTADLSIATGHPALRAVWANAPDFDPYRQLVRPGGLGSSTFIKTWGAMVAAMDGDDMAGALVAAGEISEDDTWFINQLIPGLLRPDPDPGHLFEQALADHQNNLDLGQAMSALTYRDDPLEAKYNLALEDMALYHRLPLDWGEIASRTVVGWMDSGVVEGALEKFLTYETAQQVFIQPTGHVMDAYVNPYGENRPLDEATAHPELAAATEFFDRFLVEEGSAPPRKIFYYTYGLEAWRESETWPPDGVSNERWYLQPEQGLSPSVPAGQDGADVYEVDFQAGTGAQNRWLGQMGKPVNYGDRREEDRKLLTYTSAPLDEDLEITGSPIVRLHLASTHIDGAFFVYLEDVGPDGYVAYLTEGLLRGMHRVTADPVQAPYHSLGVYRTYSRVDAAAMIPGELSELVIQLMPISVQIRKGHRVRLAVAGHDAALGDRYPESGTPVLTVQRNAVFASHVELPVIH